jgi:hypothetical protein
MYMRLRELHLTFHTSGKFIVEGTILHFIMTSIFQVMNITIPPSLNLSHYGLQIF